MVYFLLVYPTTFWEFAHKDLPKPEVSSISLCFMVFRRSSIDSMDIHRFLNVAVCFLGSFIPQQPQYLAMNTRI